MKIPKIDHSCSSGRNSGLNENPLSSVYKNFFRQENFKFLKIFKLRIMENTIDLLAERFLLSTP